MAEAGLIAGFALSAEKCHLPLLSRGFAHRGSGYSPVWPPEPTGGLEGPSFEGGKPRRTGDEQGD